MVTRLLCVVLFIVLTACTIPNIEQTKEPIPKAEIEVGKKQSESREPKEKVPEGETETAKKLTETKQETKKAQPKKEAKQPKEEQEKTTKPVKDKEEAANTESKSEKKSQTLLKSDQSSSSMSTFEKKVVELVNLERKKLGYTPLKADSEISNIARKKSADMRDHNYFSHQSPTYGSPFDMLKKAQIRFTLAGENIAAGQQSPNSVVKSWMNSEGHRKNILNPDYTHLGVGYQRGGSYGTYWTQLFVKK